MILYLVLDATGYPIRCFRTLEQARECKRKEDTYKMWRVVSVHVED